MMDANERLKRMRLLATGLLVVMVVVYFVSRTLELEAEGWAWVRAFAEAAMVGALADWFAVTALFRHPLGLPIPHTAIVSKQKDRIGAALGRFVRGSFLSRDEVGKHWREWQPVGRLARWLSDEENAQATVRRVAGWLPTVFEKAEGEAMAKAGAERLREGLAALPVGRLVSVLLEGFLRSPSRRSVMAPVLGRLGRAVTENREWVMEEARKGAPLRSAKILGAVTEVAAMVMSGRAVEKLSVELKAASEDENHVLFEKIEDSLRETLDELEDGGGADWEAFKQRVLSDPETQALLEEALRSAGKYLLAESRAMEEGAGETRWGTMLSRVAARLSENKDDLEVWEQRVEEWVAGFFDRYGEGIETLITRSVERWEAEDLIVRLENQVGSDLQFIRINGTIIGGTVGVLLHALGKVIWGG